MIVWSVRRKVYGADLSDNLRSGRPSPSLLRMLMTLDRSSPSTPSYGGLFRTVLLQIEENATNLS